MAVINRLKRLSKRRLVSYIFLFIVLGYSLSLSLLFSSVMTSVSNTIEEIEIPDGNIKIYFVPVDPELEIPFSVNNEGLWDLTDLELKISVDVVYFVKNTSQKMKLNIFEKRENFGNVYGLQKFKGDFKGDEEDFDIDALSQYWNDFDVYKEVEILLTIEISGKYFYGLVPFRVEYEEMELDEMKEDECPTCN